LNPPSPNAVLVWPPGGGIDVGTSDTDPALQNLLQDNGQGWYAYNPTPVWVNLALAALTNDITQVDMVILQGAPCYTNIVINTLSSWQGVEYSSTENITLLTTNKQLISVSIPNASGVAVFITVANGTMTGWQSLHVWANGVPTTSAPTTPAPTTHAPTTTTHAPTTAPPTTTTVAPPSGTLIFPGVSPTAAIYSVEGALAASLLSGQAWNSLNYAPVYVVIDLGAQYTVSGIQLSVDQQPAGITAHKIYFTTSNPADIFQTSPTFIWNGTSHDTQVISYSFTAPFTARYFAVYTTQSPSWVAWYWMKVFGTAK